MHRFTAAAVILLATFALAQDAGTAAPAQPPPSADEVRRVLDYYFNGKDRGPTLVELKACLKVDGAKDSPTRFECIEEVKGPVKLNTNVHGWMTWFLPKGSNYDDVVLQFSHEGTVRSTIDVKLDQEMRARTWRSQNMSKKGKWTISVVRAGTVLGTTTVTVE
ncbi:MAG: hypothetical protein H6Q89_2063 [Myxococcaceae bacterium]|nr:hypothetical protein [Myxococcaceae bacterium]